MLLTCNQDGFYLHSQIASLTWCPLYDFVKLAPFCRRTSIAVGACLISGYGGLSQEISPSPSANALGALCFVPCFRPDLFANLDETLYIAFFLCFDLDLSCQGAVGGPGRPEYPHQRCIRSGENGNGEAFAGPFGICGRIGGGRGG